MSDTTTSSGYGKIGASIVAAWAASYLMTQLSLHGVNFTELGVPSEIVKSTLVGTLVGFFTWISPSNLVDSVTEAIVFCKDAISEWKKALDNPSN